MCVYYLMWNIRWKAMCFPTRAIIPIMNLGVVISVVNGQAWDKATT
jgi:hypothetical protein